MGLYVCVCVLPLVFALAPTRPPGRGLWTDLSIGLGFVGLAMLGLQFAITARFHGLTAPFGMDVVLRFHRQISIVAFVFVLLHPAILLVVDPAVRSLLNPLTAPARTLFGLAAVLMLTVLVAMSVWRLRLRIGYETWRVTHGLLSVGVVGAALAHVEGVGYYVSLPWKRALWAAMSIGLIGLLVWVRLVKPILLLRKPWEVEEIRPELSDVWTLVLRPDKHDGLSFEAGQFAWLIIHHTPFNVVEHPFSFSNSSEDEARIEFTIKELGDFTSSIGEVEPGTRAYVDGPYGVFTTERAEAAGFVLFAGGIGITPVISILRTLADRQDQRPLLLFYGNPRVEEVAFQDELDRLRLSLDLRVVHVIEDPPEDWEGESGFMDRELIERHLQAEPAQRSFFLCGPDPMMDAVEAALAEMEVPRDRIVMERFNLI